MNNRQMTYQQNPMPLDEMRYRELPMIIFRDFDHSGKIEVSRYCHPKATVGANFWQLTKIPRKRIEKLREKYIRHPVMWLKNAWGVGILCSAFYRWSGVLIYFHVHDDVRILENLYFSREVRDMMAFLYDESSIPVCDETYDFEGCQAYREAVDHLKHIKEVINLFGYTSSVEKISYLTLQQYLLGLSYLVGCKLIFHPYQGDLKDLYTYDGGNLRYLYLRWLFILQKLGNNKPIDVSIILPFLDSKMIGVAFRVDYSVIEKDVLYDIVVHEIKDLVRWGTERHINTNIDINEPIVKINICCDEIRKTHMMGDFKQELILYFPDE